MDLLDQIPDYREAIARETETRDLAFTDLPEMVCGLEVLPLTHAHVAMMSAAGSPFVTGGEVREAHVVQFLWCVCPQRAHIMPIVNALRPWAPRLAAWILRRVRRRFTRTVAGLKYAYAADGIKAYLDEAFMDAPGDSKAAPGFTPSYYSAAAAMVVTICSQLPWGEAAVLHMPLKRLWQYLRCLDKRADPNTILFNPSDKIRSEWAKTQNKGK